MGINELICIFDGRYTYFCMFGLIWGFESQWFLASGGHIC